MCECNEQYMLYTLSSITEYEVTVRNLTFPSTLEVDLYNSQFDLTNVQAKIYTFLLLSEKMSILCLTCVGILHKVCSCGGIRPVSPGAFTPYPTLTEVCLQALSY